MIKLLTSWLLLLFSPVLVSAQQTEADLQLHTATGNRWFNDTYWKIDSVDKTLFMGKLYRSRNDSADWLVGEYRISFKKAGIMIKKLRNVWVCSVIYTAASAPSVKRERAEKEVPVLKELEKKTLLLKPVSGGCSMEVTNLSGRLQPSHRTCLSFAEEEVPGTGLINILSGKVIMAPSEEILSIDPFSNTGIAVFQSKDKLYGLIRSSGKIKALAEYLRISFNDSLQNYRFVRKISDMPSRLESETYMYTIPVTVTYDLNYTIKAGYFDPEGNITVEGLEYASPPDPYGNFWAVKNGSLHLYKDYGNSLIYDNALHASIYSDLIILSCKGSRNFLLSRQGEKMYENAFSELEWKTDKGTWFNYIVATENGKTGFFTTKGKVLLPCISEKYSVFSFGAAGINIGGKGYYIDTTGNRIFPNEFDEVHLFNQSKGKKIYANIKMNGKYGTIDRKGEWIIQPIYDHPIYFDSGDTTSVKKNGKEGLINFEGKVVVPFKYEKLLFEQRKAYVAFLEKGKWGFLDIKSGKIVISPRFDRVHSELHEAFIGKESYVIRYSGNHLKAVPLKEFFLKGEMADIIDWGGTGNVIGEEHLAKEQQIDLLEKIKVPSSYLRIYY